MMRLAVCLAGLMLLVACSRQPRPASVSATRTPFTLPQQYTENVGPVTVHVFENGLTLIHQKREANAIVGISAYIRTGACEDSDDKAGLTNLMMCVLTKGTTRRTSDGIAEEAALLGMPLSASAGQDFCSLTAQCVKADLGEALDLYSDVLFEPAFPVDQVNLERQKVAAAIRMRDDQSGQLAAKHLRRELFGSHPYGRPLQGEPESLPAILAGDLLSRHRSTFIPANIVVAVVGNVDFDTAKSLVERHLGSRQSIEIARYTTNKIIAPGAAYREVVKDAEQAYVMLGHLTCPAGDPDEVPLQVARTILGGGMSSRLFSDLRDKQGLAYSVGASAAFFQQQGFFMAYIATSPENLDPVTEEPETAREMQGRAVSGLWREIDRLRSTPVPAEELERARNYVAGQFLRSSESSSSAADQLAYWYSTGRGVNYGERFLAEVEAVTSRDIMRVANKYFLDPTLVIVRPKR